MSNDSNTTQQTIKTWDTEDEIAVAWGTHDAEKATQAYAAEHITPPFDPAELPDFANGIKRWARPDVLDLDEGQGWPDEAMSHQPVDGWIPFLTWGWQP